MTSVATTLRPSPNHALNMSSRTPRPSGQPTALSHDSSRSLRVTTDFRVLRISLTRAFVSSSPGTLRTTAPPVARARSVSTASDGVVMTRSPVEGSLRKVPSPLGMGAAA